MDKRIAIWNVLHDGELTAVSEYDGKTLTMFVSIPYLRGRIKPLGDSFVLKFSGLTRCEYFDSDNVLKSFQDEIQDYKIEILHTDSEEMPIKVATTMGYLILDYEKIHLTLDTGQETDFETIERVCHEYWDEWDKKQS